MVSWACLQSAVTKRDRKCAHSNRDPLGRVRGKVGWSSAPLGVTQGPVREGELAR